MKYVLIILLLIPFNWTIGQNTDSFSRIIPIAADENFFENVTSNDDYFYFSTRNIDGDNITISLFQTNKDFEIVNSIETFKIRDRESAFMTYMNVYEDRLIMMSNAEIDGKNYLYTHSISLNLDKQIVIDSIELNYQERFSSFQFKELSNGNIYTFGTILRSSSSQNIHISSNYIEFTPDGKFVEIRKIEGPENAITTFDIHPDSNQYFVTSPFTSYLIDSSFNLIHSRPNTFDLPLENFISWQALSGSCEYVSKNKVQCVSSANVVGQIYSNFIAEYAIVDNEIILEDAISLHPAGLDHDRTRLVYAQRDDQENYYFAYTEPFSDLDIATVANRVFVTKFDKNLNQIFFKVYFGNNEYTVNGTHLDKNNNLVIYGGLTTPSSIDLQNFYISVNEDGDLITSLDNSLISVEGFGIYPNPCTEYIGIDVPALSSDAQYSVYSVDGKLLKQGNLGGTNKNKVLTNQLNSGMYILHILDGQKLYREKFIKQ